MAEYCSFYETTWGRGAVTASEAGLLQVLLPDSRLGELGVHARSTMDDKGTESPHTREAARLLCRYFDGELVTFDVPLDAGNWSPFSAAVYGVVRAIPYGELSSYGHVAAACGHPGAARAVGRVMAANRLPIVIPCHRVVAASGALTGYSAPGGLLFKATLLQLEGAKY